MNYNFRSMGATAVIFASLAAFAEAQSPNSPGAVISISSDGDARGLFDDEKVQLPSGLREVKLAIEFDQPIAVAKVSIESCGSEFRDGAQFFIFPGWRSKFAEGGQKKMSVQTPDPLQKVRSLAIVFGSDMNLCLSHLRLESSDHKAIVITPRLARQHDLQSRASESIQKAFAAAGILGALNSEVTMADEDDRWVMRLRSDGSFFLRGFTDEMAEARAFSVLGRFAIVNANAHEVRMKISAKRAGTPSAWDGLIPDDSSSAAPSMRNVDDELALQKWSSHDFILRNRTKVGHRTLPFSDLTLRRNDDD